MTTRTLGWLALWGLMACGGPTEAPPPPQPPPPVPGPAERPAPVDGTLAVELHVDVREPYREEMVVRQTWTGARSPLRFKRHGDDSYVLHDITLTVDGTPRHLKRDGRLYTPQPPIDGTAVLTYRVRPGGDGAHGRQGFLDNEFGVFDGRAWLLPVSRQPIGSARLEVARPKGWRVATSLEPDGDGWRYPANIDPLALAERLRTDCHAVGPFDEQVRTVGGQPVRSYVHETLGEGFRDYLHRATLDAASWLHGSLGWAPDHPRAFVRTPARGDRVYGGSSAGGACFEGRATDKRVRNAQLLVRRMAEPIAQGPHALAPARDDDRWFLASLRHYLDLVATEATGGLEPGLLGPDLWRDHLAAATAKPHLVRVPLRDELQLDGPARDYVRQLRGPLAIHLLAALVAQRTDTTLEAVLADRLRRAPEGPFDLDVELARAGVDVADFFAAYVDGDLPLVPRVPGLVDDDVRDRARRPPVATSAGAPLSVDYIAHLAASGRFDRYQELVDHLATEGPRRQALAAAGVHLVDATLRDHLGGIDPRTHADLVEAEARWPLPGVTGGPPQLSWGAHPAAGDLQRLLAAEADYERSLVDSGVERIGVRRGKRGPSDSAPEVLVVPPDEPFTIFARYRQVHPALSIEVWRDQTRHFAAPVVMEPGWVRNRIEVGAADRPSTPGPLEIRIVLPDGRVLSERRLWQHPVP